MGSIYGWLSTAETPSSPTWVDSQRAASKCLTTATSKSSFIRHKMGEVAGHGINLAPSVYQTSKLLVILEGSPQWQDSELAEVAKNQGSAQALD